ncbi:DUF2497 domain-containing protein [Phyllobacterium sp. OV277]|uniref:PopZ family protein n=1 Tax=Phyllobacterium sp. OV277 TaxID=1882772 RepID=UPI0008927AC7|nr:DUF2497 domain-containing protein [Phyllobacterium sp. OV277]SDN83689.1 hypothetical protein SAMN05443582_101267 [Phyllobacterium sp. OV277]
MAQSSSVAREPSMEEILASIRRIIEESDTTRTDDVVPTPVNSDVPVQTAAMQVQPQSYDLADEEVELPPREGIAVSHPAPQSFEAPLSRPFSPLQSKLVEREATVTESVVQPEVLETPVIPETSVHEPMDYHGHEAETFEVPEAIIETPVVAPVPYEEPAIEPEQIKAEEQTFTPEPVEAVSDASEATIGDEVSLDLERALEPILSEATERQVSAAFGDLSFAVQNEQRRSFDEIAQEIMRPLLQDWLDNNLPNLVERLVREEIERVARGAKR